MKLDEQRAHGLAALGLATQLLQRNRLANADAGIWEAADVQWWWRTPRSSDTLDQLFWLDRRGPVAAVLLTDWGQTWGCDLLYVADHRAVALPEVLWRAVERIDSIGLNRVEMLVRDDDHDLLGLLPGAGFAPTGDRSGHTLLAASDRPPPAPLPPGFVVVDRLRSDTPHPMGSRNGERVDERLRQCSLYDPALDLAVMTGDQTAGYALFWFDSVTKVGLVEPMRIEDEFQRRGLGRALLSAGVERLAARGALTLKVGFATEAARGLYVGAGFRVAAMATSHVRSAAAATSGQRGSGRSSGPT